MGKRITAISLNNYKGYFGKYEPILLPNGENVLIYGENGSGKSSLYKALNNFFLSSRDTSIQFIKNKYNEGEIGEISIEFSDYDNNNGVITNGSGATYLFSDTVSNHNIPLVQDAALVKGFLDYTDLLKIYFHDDPQPNLFKLIVLTILGEHIPISSGGNFKFIDKWNELQYNLIENCYTRNDLTHRNAYNFLAIFETHLKATLDDVFEKTNTFLNTYFIDFNISLDYILKPLEFNYQHSWKSSWYTTADLRLIVKKNGQTFADGYSNYLNEARLSAIAICMYLASLSVTNKNIDLKVLYLDDVFIGLDSGNRIPILNILKNEFSDYQKFISTYDRYWFELAKRHFSLNNDNLWKSIELYVGYGNDSLGNKIDRPIIIIGESYFEKAIKYLHHNSNPDYPAAANYFRKALEEIISSYIPKYELIDENDTQIPEFKLTNLTYRAKSFLERLRYSSENINTIISLLSMLLHPLSHHEIASPIYKSELLLIENAFLGLQEQLRKIDLVKLQCKYERGKSIKIKFLLSASPKHCYEFDIKLKDSIVLHKTEGSILKLPTHCFLTKMSGIQNDEKLPSFTSTNREDSRFKYISLSDAVNKLRSYLLTIGVSFSPPTNYLDCIEYYEVNNWQPIRNLLTWKE